MMIKHKTLPALRHIATLTLALTLVFAPVAPATAQGLFEPTIKVNNKVVTKYELDQRALLLKMLNSPGDPATEARKQLIEERLKLDAAETNGLFIDEEAIVAGVNEFAGRFNMDSEQFYRAIEAGGVSKQSFRDFVKAGISWRELVRAKFGARVKVSDGDIDRAVSATTGGASVQVLISEIIMPAPPRQAAAVQARAAQISQITSESAFAKAARRYSASPAKRRGGRLNWMPITDLPAGLRPIIMGLAPGEVSDPIPLQNAVALFQMRAIKESKVPAPQYAAIEYAAYYIAGGRSEAALSQAAKIKSRIDTCDDLYGIAKGQPAEVLERGSKPPAEIPQDIAFELAKLDNNEVSTTLTRAKGQTLVFLMLCGRTSELDENASRETLGISLQNRRLESFANGYLEQLRAEARIINK